MPMPNIWFTADTHFGHDRIVELSKRPFSDITEHDRVIASRWNNVVAPNDTVYHLGDFAWHSLADYRKRLNGKIHLVCGNHDRLKSQDHQLFESVSDIKKVRHPRSGNRIYMMHYAMRVWNQSHHGAWHLYGHSHGSLPDDSGSLSFDVGVDCHNYAPISLDRVDEIMSKKEWKPVDRHGAR